MTKGFLMRHTILTATVSAALAAVALAGCTTAPNVVATPRESLAVPRTIQLDAADVDFRYKDRDYATVVDWIDGGQSVRVTTRGSGSCPTVPTSLEVLSVDSIVVNVADRITDPAGACSADLSPHTSRIALPADVTGRPLTVTLVNSDEINGSGSDTFVLD